MNRFFKILTFFILFLYSNLLFADTYADYTYTVDSSATLIHTGNVKSNDHDRLTITITETGTLSITLDGSSTARFDLNTSVIPDTKTTDPTLTTYGPIAYNAGDVIYVGANAPGDNSEQTYNLTFTLDVPNTAPTDISLSNNLVSENDSSGTIIGLLSSTDVDVSDTFTYTLAGGVDDANFSISGSNLLTNTTFDYATKSLYSIRIRTDDGEATYEEDFNITIVEGTQPIITTPQIFTIDDSASNGDTLGTVITINSPTEFNITNDSSAGTFSIDNSGVITVTNTSNLDYNTTTSYILGILAANVDGSDEENVTINVTHIIAPNDSNTYGCDMFGSVIVTYDYLDVSGTANAQACGTENISYPDGQISGTIDCLSDIACGGTGAACERVDPPANQLTYDWTHPNSPIVDESPINPSPLTNMSYGNVDFGAGDAVFNATAVNPNNGNNYMYIGDATFDQTLISFTSGDYYFESFTISTNKNNTANFAIDSSNGPVRIFIKNNLSFELNNLYLNNSGIPSDLFIYVGGDFSNPGNGGGNTLMNAYFYVEGNVLLNNNSNNWIIEGGITGEGTITIAGNNPDFIQTDTSGDLGYGACSICFQDLALTPSTTYTVSNSFVNLLGNTIYDLNVHKTYTGTNVRSGCTTTDGSCSQTTVDIDFDNLENFTYGNSYDSYTFDIGNYAVFQFSTIEDTNTHVFDSTEYDTSIKVNNNIDIDALFIADYYDKASNGKFYHTIVESCNLGSAGNNFSPGVLDAVDTNCTSGVPDSLAGCAGNNISTKIVAKSYDLNVLDSNASSGMLFGTALAYRSGETMLYKYIGEVNATDESGITTFTLENSDSANSWATVSNTLATKEAWIQFYYCDSSSNWRDCYVVGGDNVYITKNYDANESSSHDKFSIRPEKFTITDISTQIKSALSQDFNVSAEKFGSGLASGYTISNTDYALDINKTAYLPNDTIADLNGTLSVTSFNFTDGFASDVSMSFNDVGKITMKLQDIHWADIDIGDTDANCSNETSGIGRYICGETNATFIPDHFTFSDVNLYDDNNNSNFTYLSNDLNISAHVGLTITAKNNADGTTLNFDSSSWENPVDINLSISTTNTPAIIKDEINTTQNIGFSNGVKVIAFDESNSSRNLMFNFTREVNTTLNPFIVNGSELTLNASSTYTSTNITGSSVADRNATFLYGRTHASRQRFDSNVGNTFIYYESFCYGTDSNSRTCDKTILPNGVNSKRTNDLRWFMNENHNSTNDGVVGTVTQRASTILVTSNTPTTATPATVTLTYNENYGYPYKTTMENNASSWLIYNEDDFSATKNLFSVEFEGGDSAWSGIHETDSTTDDSGAVRTNRRSMW